MKRTIAILVAAALLAACSTPEDDFVKQGLDRKPDKVSSLPETPQPPSVEDIKKLVDPAASQLREKWEKFAYGSVLDEPSFKVQYIEPDQTVDTGCSDWPRMVSGSVRPFQCGKILYVPINGMRIFWQEKHVKPSVDSVSLFILLASGLDKFYVQIIKNFARNVFRRELKDPRSSEAFAKCMAGVMASTSFDVAQAKVENGAFSMVMTGFSATVEVCYNNYWL